MNKTREFFAYFTKISTQIHFDLLWVNTQKKVYIINKIEMVLIVFNHYQG